MRGAVKADKKYRCIVKTGIQEYKNSFRIPTPLTVSNLENFWRLHSCWLKETFCPWKEWQHSAKNPEDVWLLQWVCINTKLWDCIQLIWSMEPCSAPLRGGLDQQATPESGLLKQSHYNMQIAGKPHDSQGVPSCTPKILIRCGRTATKKGKRTAMSASEPLKKAT